MIKLNILLNMTILDIIVFTLWIIFNSYNNREGRGFAHILEIPSYVITVS